MSAGAGFRPEDYELPPQFRPRRCARLWKKPAARWQIRLESVIANHVGQGVPPIFFRADDIGAGGRAFTALSGIFRRHRVPLAMAVVPAWLSSTRIEQLFRDTPLDEDLWGWHQHGWRHVNWQRSGKKSEFGSHRDFERQWKDIWKGRHKMSEIFDDHLLPVFTPPWNRLSPATLKILHELSFAAVSLADPMPRGHKANSDLLNLRVQFDLHTRKDGDARDDFENLLGGLDLHLGQKEPLGIMIHHQYMTFFAFEFLDFLLDLLKNKLQTRLPTFAELVDNRS